MTLPTTRDDIDDLRQLLKDLEQPKDCVCDPVALDSLKQIVRFRIAALEATEGQESALIASVAFRRQR